MTKLFIINFYKSLLKSNKIQENGMAHKRLNKLEDNYEKRYGK